MSLKKALESQGFVGTGRSDTELNQWVNSEKEKLSEIMLAHNIEWEQKGTHEKHKSVSEFKLYKLVEECEALETKKQDCIADISKYKKAEDFALATAKKLEDEALKMPEPTSLMSAKTYKTKYAEPFIKKLIKTIKDLARRCFRAEKEAEHEKTKIKPLKTENEELHRHLWKKNIALSKAEVKARDFDRIKKYVGAEQINRWLKEITQLGKNSRHLGR